MVIGNFRTRLRASLVTVAAATLLAACGSTTSAPSPSRDLTPAAPSASGPSATASSTEPRLEYVNLGDSYSAGAGVQPPAQYPLECLQSNVNAAHLLAAQHNYRLVDYGCQGADTSDFYRSQYPDLWPQLHALKPSTRLVTLMIGGNNNDTFSGSINACKQAHADHPAAPNPCETASRARFFDPISTQTEPAVIKALRDVKAAAPQARVFLLGYPWITPATGDCPAVMPIAPGDMRMLHELQGALNAALQRAAAATGVTFVDAAQASTGHDACQPVGTRWIEPLVTDALVPVHPNALGLREMAKLLDAAVTR